VALPTYLSESGLTLRQSSSVEVLCGRPSPTPTLLGIEFSPRGGFGKVQTKSLASLRVQRYFLGLKIMDVRFPTFDEPPEKACSGVNQSTVQAYAEALRVGWQSSAGPSIPKWPQRSNDFISNSFGASISDSGFLGGSTWDFSDDALWKAGVWENWDLELAATTAPNSDFPASVSPGDNSFLPNYFPQPQPANNWGCEDYVTATTESSEKFDVNLNGSNIFAGKQRAYEPSQRETTRPTFWFVAANVWPSGEHYTGDHLFGPHATRSG
jgi:hypothetical protein